MKPFVDCLLLNRIQFESMCDEVVLSCIVFEDQEKYETDITLSSVAMNRVLNEICLRGIELDFDTMLQQMIMPDGEALFCMDLQHSNLDKIYLPLTVLPTHRKLLRAS